MEIEELPDLKIAWHESYKCLDVPLLEYVWIIANKFMPAYEDVSAAPAIFANRYIERNHPAQLCRMDAKLYLLSRLNIRWHYRV